MLDFDAKKVTDQMLKALAERFTKIAKSVRCPDHHKTATVKPIAGPRGKLRFNISGCCEKLKKAVEAKLK